MRQLVLAGQTVLPAAGAECVDGFVHPIEAGPQWREPAPALSLGPRAEDRRATVQPVEHCRIDGIQPLPQVDPGLPLRAEVPPSSLLEIGTPPCSEWVFTYEQTPVGVGMLNKKKDNK